MRKGRMLLRMRVYNATQLTINHYKYASAYDVVYSFSNSKTKYYLIRSEIPNAFVGEALLGHDFDNTKRRPAHIEANHLEIRRFPNLRIEWDTPEKYFLATSCV